MGNRLVAVTAACLMAVATWGASPAHADGGLTLAASDGVIGVLQEVTATVPADSPVGQVSLYEDGREIASTPIGGPDGTTARTSWLPEHAGHVALEARYTPGDGGDTRYAVEVVRVERVDTRVVPDVPQEIRAGTEGLFTATVRAEAGTYVPTGFVTFYTSEGHALAKAELDRTGYASALIRITWGRGRHAIYARYDGDEKSRGSTGHNGFTVIDGQTETPAVLSLEMPETAGVGDVIPVTIRVRPGQGLTVPTHNGSVVVTVGTGTPHAPVAVHLGVATTKLRITKAGTWRVTAEYLTAAGKSGGETSATIRVGGSGTFDTITLTRVGETTPWTPGSVATLTNGSDAELVATSASGAPVTLSVTGPCSLNGTTLHIDGAGELCQVKAVSPGGNNLDAVSATYLVATALGSQTATVKPPANRTLKVRYSLKLAPTTSRTNIGQPITWFADQGAKVCTISVSDGWYRVIALRKGRCTVTGVARPVTDQWSEFRVTRTYTVID